MQTGNRESISNIIDHCNSKINSSHVIFEPIGQYLIGMSTLQLAWPRKGKRCRQYEPVWPSSPLALVTSGNCWQLPIFKTRWLLVESVTFRMRPPFSLLKINCCGLVSHTWLIFSFRLLTGDPITHQQLKCGTRSNNFFTFVDVECFQQINLFPNSHWEFS